MTRKPLILIPEFIIAAAVVCGNGIVALQPPARHGDCIKLAAELHPTFFILPEHQGFVTSHLRFVQRVEAKQIAMAAGQLLERASKGDELFSEDLW